VNISCGSTRYQLGLPICREGVSLNEVPGELAYYFSVGNCTQGCPGCHSASEVSWLYNPITYADFMSLKELLEATKRAKQKGCTAVVLMGGTTNKGVTIGSLTKIIKALSEVLPVGLYSGSDKDPQELLEAPLSWYKYGSYQADKGPLGAPTSNQHLLARAGLTKGWREITDQLTNRKDV